MRGLVELLVRMLVGRPDGWEIKERTGTGAVMVFEIRVAEQDLGRVVGTGGSHMAAVRTIVQAAGRRQPKRYVLELSTLERA